MLRSSRSRRALALGALGASILAGGASAAGAAPLLGRGAADLAVAGSLGATAAGEPQYHFDVTNVGTATARSSVLSIRLDAGQQLLAAPGCVSAAGRLVCGLGDLAVGDSAAIEVAVHDLRTGATGATADAATATRDADATNDSARVDRTVNEVGIADMQVAGSVSGLDANGELAYTFTATNGGDDDARSVVLTTLVPADQRIVSAPGCAVVARTVRCGFGHVPYSDPTRSVVITTHPTRVGRNALTAIVSASTFDPNAANDQATAAVDLTEVAIADVAISGVSVTPVRTGRLVRLAVTNLGDDDAAGVMLVVPTRGIAALPATGCAVLPFLALCPVGSLSVGATRVVGVVLQPVGRQLRSTLAVSALAATVDPVATNNVRRFRLS